MSKKKKWFFLLLTTLIIFIFGFLYLIPKFIFPLIFPLYDFEAIRISSPDKKVDAIEIQRRGGAKIATVKYLVYIVPNGKKIQKKDKPVFKALNAYNLSLLWKNNHTLLIEYEQADIYHFQNLLRPLTGYEVRIEEKQKLEKID